MLLTAAITPVETKCAPKQRDDHYTHKVEWWEVLLSPDGGFMKSLIFAALTLTGCVSATSSPTPLSVERPIRIAVCDELADGKHCQFEDFGQYDVGVKDGEFFVSSENLSDFGAKEVVFRVHPVKDVEGEDITKDDVGAAILTSPAYKLEKGESKITHTFQVKPDQLVEGRSYIVIADYGGAEAMAYIGVEGAFKIQLMPH